MRLFIIGGDERLRIAANALQKSGFDITDHETKDVNLATGIAHADAVILGLPVSRDGETVFAPHRTKPIFLRDIYAACAPDTLFLCGKPSDDFSAQLTKRGAHVIDYAAREELALLNAVPTAEGALEIALHELPITLWQANCLVIGCGRIGKYMAHILKALGARVTVSARRVQDLAYIRMMGFAGIRTDSIAHTAGEYALLINTVPSCVIDRTVLSRIRRDALLIDLASLPGGVDITAANEQGIRVIHALSLPGKVAPVTAGNILCETIQNILMERDTNYGSIRH